MSKYFVAFLIGTISYLSYYYGFSRVMVDENDQKVLDRMYKRMREIAGSDINVNMFSHWKETFTLNKKDVYLCLRDPHTGEFYDDNLLTMAAVHELAHVMDKNWSFASHGESFNDIYNTLMRRAIQLGYYNPNKKIPEYYCSYSMKKNE